MAEIAVSGKSSPTKEPGWLMISRVVVVIGTGELAASLASGHTNWGYLTGLLLGWALEIILFPRLRWKRNIVVLMVVIIAGLLRVALKFTSP